MTTRRLALAALAVLVAGAGAVAWRLSRPPPDDETLVRALLDDAAPCRLVALVDRVAGMHRTSRIG